MGFIPSQIALMNACSERVNTNRANKQATNAQKHRRREVRMLITPRCACAVRVTVVVLSLCVGTCYMSVCPHAILAVYTPD